MANQSDRIVPRDAEGTAIYQVADLLRMDLERAIDADPAQQIPEEDIYADRDGSGTTLHHVFDPQSELSYFVVKGPKSKEFETSLREKMETYSIGEILDELSKAKKKAKVAAVYRLGIAAPATFDQKVLDALVEAMHDPDRAVRHAAVWATAYPGWKQFEKPLAEVRDSDEDEEVREDAGLVLEAMKG
jgi:hypothetical protein